jgi:uncharacterized protein (TIGR03086 family)
MDVEMLDTAMENTGKIVANIKSTQLEDSTPCPKWNVRDLLNHLVANGSMMAEAAHGAKVESPADDYIGDDHVAAWEKAAGDLGSAFREPGVMDKTFALPWGETPASMVLGLAIADTIIHGWDLAKATDQEPIMDEDIAEAVYGMTTSMMQPLGEFPREGSFEAPVEVADDAPYSDKALAYLGRQP